MDNILIDSQKYADLAIQFGISNGLKILAAIAVFLIGKRIARLITNTVTMAMTKNDVDADLTGFINSLLYWVLFSVVCIAALSQIGIQTASLLAVLGTAGLAVGLALQGSLSNFAAGILIMLLRPFKVDDYVEMAGESGAVRQIRVFTTELRTGDNKCVIIPNSRVLASNIINHSSTGSRRVDMVIGIGYQDDIDQARDLINKIVEQEDLVLDFPETVIAVSELADNSVNLIVRPWVNTEDYWTVNRSLLEQIKKAFDENGISIPFPQREIHIVGQEKS